MSESDLIAIANDGTAETLAIVLTAIIGAALLALLVWAWERDSKKILDERRTKEDR